MPSSGGGPSGVPSGGGSGPGVPSSDGGPSGVPSARGGRPGVPSIDGGPSGVPSARGGRPGVPSCGGPSGVPSARGGRPGVPSCGGGGRPGVPSCGGCCRSGVPSSDLGPRVPSNGVNVLVCPGIRCVCKPESPGNAAPAAPAGGHCALPRVRSHGVGVPCGITVPAAFTRCGSCVPRLICSDEAASASRTLDCSSMSGGVSGGTGGLVDSIDSMTCGSTPESALAHSGGNVPPSQPTHASFACWTAVWHC